MKFERIKPGMVLYDVHSYRMGNTTVRTMGCWDVRVRSVDAEKRTAVVSWNGNRDETWRENQLTKLREKEPVFKVGPLGNKRLSKRGEVA